jgi:predicted nucleic acid-binding protein
MSVIVDTTVLSLAFRRDGPRGTAEERELVALVRAGRVVMLGPVRQELLSGIRTNEQFRVLRDRLRAFPDHRLRAEDYEEAASCYNRCRAKGVQGSSTDFLLSAVSLRSRFPIFTTDRDFEGFARVLRLKLHKPSA